MLATASNQQSSTSFTQPIETQVPAASPSSASPKAFSSLVPVINLSHSYLSLQLSSPHPLDYGCKSAILSSNLRLFNCQLSYLCHLRQSFTGRVTSQQHRLNRQTPLLHPIPLCDIVETTSNATIMSSYYHYNAHQHPTSANGPASSHSHHGGRSRRAPRLSTSQNSHKQFRGVRSMKELTDTASVTAFRQKFEAGRSFDLDDDMEFCPALLTESDVSILSI